MPVIIGTIIAATAVFTTTTHDIAIDVTKIPSNNRHGLEPIVKITFRAIRLCSPEYWIPKAKLMPPMNIIAVSLI